MAAPERHGAPHAGICCGFGAFWDGNWRGETRALVMPVRRTGAYWIYARVPDPRGQKHDVVHFGPFDPGDLERELALDPDLLLGAMRAQAALLDPSAPFGDSRAQLVARIVDEETRQGIPKAQLHLSEASGDSQRVAGAGAPADEKGLVRLSRIPTGTWEIRALANGYRSARVGVQQIARDTQLDLGTIALEPAPAHIGRVLGGDKLPLAKVYVSIVGPAAPDPTQRASGPTGPDGTFQLFGDLPSRFVLSLGRRVETEAAVRYEFQRRVLWPWPDKEVQDVRFQPARQVVVTLFGLNPDETGLVPMVCPAVGDPTSLCDHRKPLDPEHIPLERGFELDWRNRPPKYAFLLAPGRYQFWGTNMLHELPPTELDVVLGTGDLELPIVVH